MSDELSLEEMVMISRKVKKWQDIKDNQFFPPHLMGELDDISIEIKMDLQSIWNKTPLYDITFKSDGILIGQHSVQMHESGKKDPYYDSIGKIYELGFKLAHKLRYSRYKSGLINAKKLLK